MIAGLQVLRTRILADLATEMEGSRKELQEDMREALLIRLEAPSKILAARIREDPQVTGFEFFFEFQNLSKSVPCAL